MFLENIFEDVDAVLDNRQSFGIQPAADSTQIGNAIRRADAQFDLKMRQGDINRNDLQERLTKHPWALQKSIAVSDHKLIYSQATDHECTLNFRSRA